MTTTWWDTPAVFTILRLFGAPASSRNTSKSLPQVSGYGQILHIYQRAWCVSPFKKPIGGELTPDQRTYNYHLSRVCQAFLWSATQRVLNSPPRIDMLSVGTCHQASQGSLPSVVRTLDSNFFTEILQMGHNLHMILHHPPQPYPLARGRRLRRGIP
jgi:hypothetical protein